MYAQDYDEAYPYISGNAATEPVYAWCLLLGRWYGTTTQKICGNYLKNTEVFVCPSSQDTKYTVRSDDFSQPFSPTYGANVSNLSYAYGTTLDEQTNVESVLAADKVTGEGYSAAWADPVTLNATNDAHGTDGINTLRVGGQVQWVAADKAYKLPVDKLGGGGIGLIRNP
jgi:hypothetical protein